MRPVQKPAPAPGAPLMPLRAPDGRRLDVIRTALQDTIGFYCSICEMPVYVSDAVMSKCSRSARATATLAQWDDLLLACELCQAYRTADAVEVGDHLLPDTDATFTLDGQSPFTYELRRVDHVVTGGAANVLQRSVAPLAVVAPGPSSPHAARAQRTIDLFQLNSPHYDAAANRLSIPASQRGWDRRIELRTEAWHIALRAADTLREARAMKEAPAYLDGAILLVAGLAQATGFWSVWMTALWDAFHDRDLIRRVLLEVTDRSGYVLTGFQTYPDGGKPPWTLFTGTAVGRISF